MKLVDYSMKLADYILFVICLILYTYVSSIVKSFDGTYYVQVCTYIYYIYVYKICA